MAQKKSSTKERHFDSLIIGGGLVGLLVADGEMKQGKKVALVDSRMALGGSLQPVGAPPIPSNFEFIPKTVENQALLDRLSGQLGLEIYDDTALSNEPQTFNKGQLRAFVGFDQQKFHSRSPLSYFLAPEHFHLLAPPARWIQLLSDRFQGSLFQNSLVTDITIKDKKVSKIVLNGSTQITADQTFICCSPKKIIDWISPDELPTRVYQKLSRASAFTAISLLFTHSEPVTENHHFHFLMSSNNDIEPCLGRFFPATDSSEKQSQNSLWISFINEDFSEDSEIVGTTIRSIKRQLKRPYPEALNKLDNEKIIIYTDSYGQIKCGLKNGSFPQIDNLILASPFLAGSPFLPGALESAFAVSSLPLETLPTPDETESQMNSI